MTTLYLTEPRSLVKKDGETLVVSIPEDPKKGTQPRKVRVPLMKVDQVVVCGDSTITSPALAALLDRRVEVCFLNYFGNFVGRLSPAFSKNSLIRLEQHRAHNDPARAFALARRFVLGKLANQRALLMRSNRKRQDPALESAARTIEGIIAQVSTMTPQTAPPPDPARPQADSAQGSLLGFEGAASQTYFGVFGKMLAPDWDFAGRSRRPPTDPVNALLSYAYVLLMHQAMSAVNIVGLDPYVGFLHSSQYGKPAMALDLMEEFRPIIADSVVLTLLNNGMLKPDDFQEELGAYRLKDGARRTFLEKFEERLSTEIRHPVFKYRATYRRCLELQTRLVAKWLTRDIPNYPAFEVR